MINGKIGRATIARFSVVLVIFQGDPGQQPTSSGMATRASQHPKSRQLQEPAIASAEDLAQPGMRGSAQLGPGRGGSGGRYQGQFQEALPFLKALSSLARSHPSPTSIFTISERLRSACWFCPIWYLSARRRRMESRSSNKTPTLVRAASSDSSSLSMHRDCKSMTCFICE